MKTFVPAPAPAIDGFVVRTFAEVEAEHLARTLAHHHWNISASARALGVDRRTAYRMMKRHGITPPEEARAKDAAE